MNRLVVACMLGVVGSLAFGCASPAVGDPCIPEREFASGLGGANANELTIDVNSAQCETRVCLQHYFRGRVTCMYGNKGAKLSDQAGKKCQEVAGLRGLYTIDGKPLSDPSAQLCCPVLGSLEEAPILLPVDPQCTQHDQNQAVYCTCRCDVPEGVDRTNLCECPSGFSCVPLCDETHGNCQFAGKGKWGSYCVRDSAKSKTEANIQSVCGPGLNEKKPPTGT